MQAFDLACFCHNQLKIKLSTLKLSIKTKDIRLNLQFIVFGNKDESIDCDS